MSLAALTRRHDARRALVLAVLGACLATLSYAAGVLSAPAPPLRCAYQLGSL